ncbi:membrane protein insertion efficiency factor YidD [Rugamonas sp. CCM 8940]|uniref:membrane protein insertion efficiency factor YidD n=1 Tax=Rugamonas sp. CCM 8940 TaxID=2765359 RepID=UPI0018F33DB7|nr:membrane protein insertion efficiency factor YidD [Rugamonas sp. CCM 8940]MBJ7308643.1 membrane protein insertion efficiency factor YidD [Rugamonas sp. CCM 8940]
MKRIALAAIALYRRHLSPRKGFSCAYRVHTGRDSCSAYGQRVIQRYGLRIGLALLRRRLAACGEQYWRHRPQQTSGLAAPWRATPRQSQQAGFCDVPSCDLPSCELPSCDLPSCDIPSCTPPHCRSPWTELLELWNNCSCDWPARNRRRGKQDRYIDIRPNSGPF